MIGSKSSPGAAGTGIIVTGFGEGFKFAGPTFPPTLRGFIAIFPHSTFPTFPAYAPTISISLGETWRPRF